MEKTQRELSAEVTAQLAHDIQSRIMRIQSLRFLLQKLQDKEQTAQVQEEVAERSERLTTALNELTTLTKLQSYLLILVTQGLSAEEIQASRKLAQAWATHGERQGALAATLDACLQKSI